MDFYWFFFLIFFIGHRNIKRFVNGEGICEFAISLSSFNVFLDPHSQQISTLHEQKHQPAVRIHKPTRGMETQKETKSMFWYTSLPRINTMTFCTSRQDVSRDVPLLEEPITRVSCLQVGDYLILCIYFLEWNVHVVSVLPKVSVLRLPPVHDFNVPVPSPKKRSGLIHFVLFLMRSECFFFSTYEKKHMNK